MMWLGFLSGLIVGAAFLFVPGIFVARAFTRSLSDAIAYAPIVTVAAYSCLSELYARMGIFCSWMDVFCPTLVIGIACFAVRLLFDWRKKREGAVSHSHNRRQWCMLGLYLACGVVVMLFVYVIPLDGPAGFNQASDNAPHLSGLRSFAETGNWSSFQPAFYPSGWYIFGAMIIDALGLQTPVAANVVNTMFVGFVFPAGMFVFLRQVFADNEAIPWFGCISSFAFAAFPWKLLAFGPLYPFLASLCLAPAVAAAFIAMTSDSASRADRCRFAIIVGLGVIGTVFLHTGGIFTLIVLLAPYCFSRFLHCRLIPQRRMRILWAIGFAMLTVAVWTVFFSLPALSGVVQFYWPPVAGKTQAVMNVLMLSFRESKAQLVLGAVVLAGVIFAVRQRRYRWLVWSYAIMCTMYIICATTGDPIRHFFSGFWYNDPFRLAANAALFGTPLACWGLYNIYKCIAPLAQKKMRGDGARIKMTTAIGFTGVFALLCFFPSFNIPGRLYVDTAFGHLRVEMAERYSLKGEKVLTEEEALFAENVKKIVGDEKVVNTPTDGSAFLFGLEGINTLFRSFWDDPSIDSEEGIISRELDEYVSDSEVQEAVQNEGVRYVLQLDAPSDDGVMSMYPSYVEELWEGIQNIDEDTPGFKLVLKKDDMRLYRIVNQ